MIDPSANAWDPADGPPPTDEERDEAARLATVLAAPFAEAARAAAKAPAVESEALTALRVRATVRPDHEATKAAAHRAVEVALARQGAHTGWRRTLRSRWTWAAAAALVVAAVGVGAPAPRRDDAPGFSRAAADLFDRAVEPGAASAPSRIIFDARMRDYRSTLLAEESR